MHKQFWRAALIRALRTFVQAAVASIGTAAAIGDVQWARVLSVAALAAALSVLNAIATGLPEVDK